MLAEQRSREAYAREHGLSAKFMQAKVYWSRMMASTYRWQEAFNRIATFTVMEPAIFRGVFVGDNRAHIAYSNLPDGKVAVDTENCSLREICEGAGACKYCKHPSLMCPRCGSKLYDGTCGHCCGDPDCEVCV